MTEPVAAPDAPHRVVVFGDVFDDILVTPSGAVRSDTDTLASIERRPGGSAANTAAWLGALGSAVDFAGRTNSADVARHAEALRAVGVTPVLIGDDDLPTGTIVVIVESTTDGVDTRTMLTERGANALTSPEDVTDDVLTAASHLHFTGYTIFSGQPRAGFTRLIERAHSLGVTVSVDPGSSGFIVDHGAQTFLETVRGADILFPNREEAEALTGAVDTAAMMDALTEHFPVVALTLGRSGALIAAAPASAAATSLDSVAIRIEIPCTPEEPRDTTGAGDAFNAGFLAALIGGSRHPLAHSDGLTERLRAAGVLGVDTARRAIGIVGARPPAPPTPPG